MVSQATNFKLGINAVALLSPWTGIGQYTFHLINELQKKLMQEPVMFYAGGWSSKIRSSPITYAHPIKNIIKTFVPFPYQVSRLMQQYYFSKGSKKHKIDLYHEPNFVTFKYKGPTVITIHDLSYIHHRDKHPVDRIKHMDKHMTRSIKEAQHFIVDSDFVKNEVINYYNIPENKVTTTLLGVSEIYKPIPKNQCELALQKYGLNYGKYILSVGTLEPRKNLGMVISAFLELPQNLRKQYPLIIVGLKTLSNTALNPQINSLILNKEILLLGYVPQAHLPILYSGAKLFVYPSVYEGFGLPPLEAMACAAPVLVSNTSSLPEVVGDSGILINPTDQETWTKSMKMMLEDEALNFNYKEKGTERAKNFTWQRCAEQTLQVYNKVLNL